MLPHTLRLSLAPACFFLASLSSTSGQTTPAPAATTSAATNAPAAAPPVTPIPLGDVVTQAQSVMERLQDDRARLTPDPVTQVVGETLPVLTHQIGERETEDKAFLGTSPLLSSLQNSQAAWQSLANSLATSQNALSDRAKDAQAQITRLGQLTATWQATLQAAKKASAPAQVAEQIQNVLTAITETTQAAQSAQAQILSVQTDVATQAARINQGQADIAKAMEIARTQLFEQDHPPLWKAEAVPRTGAGIFAQERDPLRAQLESLGTYLSDKFSAVVAHLLILTLLVIGFYWIRNAIRSHAKEEAALHHAARVFDVPLATALLLALVATEWLYPLAPRLLWAIVGATALIPAVIIIRRLIHPTNILLLYATVIAYFVDQLRYVVTPTGALSRFLLIFELLAASIFLLWMLRSKHLSTSDVESNRLKRITRFYLHLAFIVLWFAGFANIFGYVHLSLLIGNGMLESSYLAVILYAAVRIADALVISALSIRPFSALGMVRRHHDLLYNNLATCICWLAFAAWLVTALQLFSLRDPLWQVGRRLLETKLVWGALTVPFGSILAFPVTVWAAFLLSRFIRFCLEEEVYPHLHLGRGIPYAASTMVHYTILVVGFFVAVKASGGDLSQFSFLAGAFGVGLGFGLQNIFNNFVSGIILLFERPIKVGDLVQIDATTTGTVQRIGIRASVILLTNGAEMIVPNGNLISNPVTNWTLSNCERLIEIPVNVVSKADPAHVLSLLLNAAKSNASVLKNPSPQALLAAFAGAALSFRLRVWVDAEEDAMKITSDLSLAINSALAKENIATG
ncbi:MAG: mechanosensitive ion channel [Methylacidiphilales bacterium]|nr:mechanosensitive ion channel [Candidatus Methylacidiphilales bacterium]